MTTILKQSLRPALRTTLWLLRIMLPITLVVSVMQYYGVIAWAAQYLNPLFHYLGLPGSSSIAFLTAATMTTYAGIAVMLTMTLTMREATILAIMALLCHALPMESTVMKKVGSSATTMVVLRVCAAIVAACYLNLVLPEMPERLLTISSAEEVSSLTVLFEEWLLSSVRISAVMLSLIYFLMVLQRVLDRYGVMRMLERPLRPLMLFFGLPENAAYLWIVGNVLGISYGSAVMIDLEEKGRITREQANEANFHLAMNHSMLEDTLVFAAFGISAFWILSTRILFAFLVVWGRKVLKKVKCLCG